MSTSPDGLTQSPATSTPTGSTGSTAAAAGATPCPHTPPCPAPDATDAEAARIVSEHLQECGYALLCNGRVLMEHGGLLPAQPDRRARAVA